MISTAYQLPFEVWYSVPAFSTNGPTDIAIEFRDGKARRDIEELLSCFLALANTGALCGAHIPPWDSGVDSGQIVSAGTGKLRVVARRMFLADEAIVVLT